MKIPFITLLFLCISLTTYSQSREPYFFSLEDITNIQESARTPWGQVIIDSLKTKVSERRKHPMDVPKEEAGHTHDFFCPVHNVPFQFNWYKPTEQYCAYCDSTWNKERINWAWINKVHSQNLAYLTSSMYIYLATGEKQYIDYMKKMLLDYADKYPNYKVHDKGRNTPEPANYSAKMFAQSLDEAVWFSDACRVYSVVKPFLKKKEIEKIETQLLREGANMLLQRGGGGNWQVWNNSGLAALGVALNDDHIVSVALDSAKVGYRHMMKTHVNRDGWWNEGSPNYHFFPLRAMLLTADAVRCMDINLFDEQFEKMFTAPVKGIYNDLTFPSHNDGWYGVSLPLEIRLYEIAYARYKNPLLLDVLQACYKVEDRLSPEALLTNVSMNRDVKLKESESFLFGHTGYGVLRSGDKAVVLKYGPSGGGHGHPDKLSIAIHNGREEIVPDLGTCAYGIPDYLNWYKRTLSHSTVVVDFKDQRPATGQLTYFEPTSMEAFTDRAYPGVDMTRNISFKGNILVDEFRCVSDTVHYYDYVIIFAEEPQIEGSFMVAELNENVPYKQIQKVKKTTFKEGFVAQTSTARINFQVESAPSFEVFVGKTSGVPPTNPGIVTKNGTEKRPVAPCYPLIIRVKSDGMKVKGKWELFP